MAGTLNAALSRRLIVGILFLNGVTHGLFVEKLKLQCSMECDEGLLALPLRGHEFGNCDWECRMTECKYSCTVTDYTQLGTGLDGCLDQCSTQNRTSACESGCAEANVQLLNYIRRNTETVALKELKSTAPNKLEAQWQISDACLEVNVLWRAQIRRLPKADTGESEKGQWATTMSNVGITGSTLLSTTIEGDALKANSVYEVRLAAFLRSRLVAYSDVWSTVTQQTVDAPSAPVFVEIPDGPDGKERIVCWKQPDESIEVSDYSVEIVLVSTPDRVIRTEVLASNCIALRDPIAGETYSINVKARNAQGESPQVKRTIDIPKEESIIRELSILSNQFNPSPLYFANRSHVWMSSDPNDYLVSDEVLVYKSQAPVDVTAIAAINSSLYIALSNGNILEAILDGSKITTSVLFHVAKHADQVSAMTVDWLSGDVYLAAIDKVIACRKVNASCSIVAVTQKNATVGGLAVEPRIGYLYYSTTDGLYSLPLSDMSSASTLLITFPPQSPPVLSLDSSLNYLLFAAVNSSIYEYDLVSKTWSNIRDTQSRQSSTRYYANIAKMASSRGRHWWVAKCTGDDGYCMMGEEEDKRNNGKELVIQQFTLQPGYGQLIGVALAREPSAPPLMPPDNVYVLFSDTAIRVTWSAPGALLFQAPNLNLPLFYNVSLRLDGQLISSTTTNDSKHEWIFDHIQPRALYTISVKACWSSFCSPDVITWGKTMAAGNLMESVDLVIATNTTLAVYNMLGKQTASYGTAPSSGKIRYLAVISAYGDYLALDDHDCMFSIDSSKKWNPVPFKPCQKSGPSSLTCFRYEAVGNMVYWCDDSGIYRSRIGSMEFERVSSESYAKSLAFFSTEALAIVHQPDYVVGLQLTGARYKSYFTCTTIDCEILAVCAVNGFGDSRVYILVAYRGSNKLEMHSTLFDGSAREMLGQTNVTLSVKSMKYYFGKFMLILEDGRIAVTEPDLQRFDYFPLLGNVEAVAFYVPGSSHDIQPTINITSINVTATSAGTMLFTWSLSPSSSLSTQSAQPTYFNVSVISRTKSTNPNNTSQLFRSIVDNPNLDTDFIPANEDVLVEIRPFDYWRSSPKIDQRLRTPPAPPSIPRNLRLYVDHVRSSYNTTARVTLVWAEPRWNGVPNGFNVTCWSYIRDKPQLTEKPSKQKVQKDPQVDLIADVETKSTQRMFTMNEIALGTVVYCQVTASNVANGLSRPSAIVEADTSIRNSSTIALVAKPDGLYMVDTSTDSIVNTVGTNRPLAPSVIGNLRGTIFAVQANNIFARNMGEFSHDFDPIILGLNTTAPFRAMAIDWIGRSVYVAGPEPSLLAKGDSVWKYSLDMRKPMEYQCSVSSGVKIVNMLHNPLENVLYFTTFNGRRYQLQKLKMSSLELIQVTPECSLLSPALCSESMMGENSTSSGLAIYGISNNGLVDVNTCSPLLNFSTNIAWDSVEDMAIQNDYVLLSTKLQLLRLHRETGALVELKSVKGGINDVKSYNFEDQPLPDVSCLQTPLDSAADFRVYPVNKTAAQVDIDTSALLSFDENCPPNMALPPTRYVIEICESPRNESGCKYFITYESKQLITGLLQNASYDIQVDKINYYANSSYSSMNHSQTFNTSQVIRLAPAKLQAKTLTPDKVLLTWEQPDVTPAPGERLKYKATVLSQSKVKIQEQDDIECPTTQCRFTVTLLKPNSSYIFRVGPSGEKRPSDLEINNNEASATTRQSPGALVSINSNFTADSMAFLWQPSKDEHVKSWAIQYARVAEDTWRDVPLDEEAGKRTGIYFVHIQKLRPLTQYRVRSMVLYDTGYDYTEEYTFITNGRRRPRDSGTTPGAPIRFRLEERPKNTGKKYFMWDDPDEGGSQIQRYILQQRDNEKAHWTIVANNIAPYPTEYPLYAGIRISPSTEFRLAAVNRDGTGKWSYATLDDGNATTGAPSRTVAVIVAVCVIVVLILVMITVLLACRKRICAKRRATTKQNFDGLNRPLPGYQRRDGQSHLDALSHISKDDLDSLPHVSRNCITASKPLGQGAFGEVYEGLACNLPRIGPKTVRVAIKTLKEGSPDVERVKFLKEAILMSKFRNPNIVQLLGVCLESEPHWIILELMEGGDLLSYLRTARPTETLPSQVTLEDLITLAVDVARGCSHLEQHHHVHRDLAARNCLLSSRDPAQRVVKIADFGMARDVYEGDYYRVEGHGLLPVRWMAPESMIDGVFTIKTDVWSFGVLLWEIMTLGQQPYPGRTNWDVLNYVRIGGRLKAPEYCPAELYDIMNWCWTFEAKDRPTFLEVVERLESLRALHQFQSDIPFPPFYPRATSSVDSKENSANMQPQQPQVQPEQPSDGQVQLFVTQASGRFQRNTKQTESQSKTNKLKKAAELLSFRKQKDTQPPPPPPSKNEIDAGRTTPTQLTVPTTPETRPTSGESFTTNTEGYEVPLLKNLRAAAAGGFTNRAYEPSTPGSMTPGPSIMSITEETESSQKDSDQSTTSASTTKEGANVYVYNRPKTPETARARSPEGATSPKNPGTPRSTGSTSTGQTPRIKPNAPKPPLKPEVIHTLDASPQSARRARSPEMAPMSYENVKPG